MDVSCPRCRAEYELEDARVPDEGVTVKCTQCAHVFRVKKKALVVTLPVKPEDAAGAQPVSELPPPAPNREWKVRQASGNLYSCRELTVLQKWIVEGKVGRDDEISLTGDTWKRLGNIPELASFFQVVEEANKARQLEALRTASNPNLQAVPSPYAPSPSQPGVPQGGLTDTWREPGFKAPFAAPPLASQPAFTQQPQGFAQPPAPQPPPAPAPPQEPNIKETLRQPSFSVPPPPTHHERPKQIDYDEDDAELEAAVKGGGKGKWVVLALLGLAVGGGAGYYFGVWVPQQEQAELERKAELRGAEEKARAEAEAARVRAAEEEARKKAEAEKAAREKAEREAAARADAGPPDAGAPAVDAGAPGKGEPKAAKGFDWYLAQGDRLRDREKAEAALDMYGKAADLEPDRVEPIAGRGLALLDLGQSLAAQAAFEQALKANGRYGPAIMGMAEAYRAQGKKAEAVKWYQKYLDVLPNGAEADVARNNIERLK